MSALRLGAGVTSAVGLAALVYLGVSSIHPIFSMLAMSALVPVVFAGLTGGFVCGLFVRPRKIWVAAIMGMACAFLLLGCMVLFGFYPGHRNPWIWFWPIWLVPSFTVGGALAPSRPIRLWHKREGPLA